MTETLLHATCVALPPTRRSRSDEEYLGVLLRGESGSGKSDLALRLLDEGWRLISDDQTAVVARAGGLIASAPPAIAGLLEVRGVGLLPFPREARGQICLVADLVPADRIERLPEETHCTLSGVRLRCLALDPSSPSAVIKLRLAAQQEADAIMDGKTARRVLLRRHNRGKLKMEKEPPPAQDQDGPISAALRRVVLVTGLSGAGRSLALDILEDLGYEAVDNPPLELLEEIVAEPLGRSVALGVDIRTRHFAVQPVVSCLANLRGDPALSTSLLFMECDDEVLQRRYTESRRRHPLAKGRPLKDGIVDERRLVSPLRDQADLLVDTTSMTPAELRQYLSAQLASSEAPAGLEIFVTSFSYRHGLPRAADLVFDVRFLKNPHYEAELRELTGQDAEVAAYIEADPEFEPFFDRLTAMLQQLLPLYEKEGKSYLTIAIGCTGGRHRSVMTSERLASQLKSDGYRVTKAHRDVAPVPVKP